jgi:hypothetical protein
MTSYGLVLLTSWHAVLAGTDVGRMPYSIVAVVLSLLPMVALVVRLASPPARSGRARPKPSRPGRGAAAPAVTAAVPSPTHDTSPL